MIKKNNKEKGFTIIETMIAISIFTVIVMIGMDALLNANLLNQKSRDMRSIMDNLSFIMEDVSRNLRTGHDFHCITGTENLLTISTPLSGKDCWGVAFQPVTGNEKFIYEVVSEVRGSTTIFYIRKSEDSGANWIQLTPDEVVVNLTASSFSILGAESPTSASRDAQQPFVTIKLVGEINFKNIKTPFSLQTSVSQRLIDI